MLELEEALSRILAAIPKPASEKVSLRGASRRVLAENISAKIDLPPFDNSSMDGYAVRTADVAAANSKTPVRLRVIGKVAAGGTFNRKLKSGQCVRLFTGSPLPRGADGVVMQEDTQYKSAGEILVLDPPRRGENIRRRGEDVKRGAALFQAGEVLTAGKISLLAANGFTRVNAGRRPIVGLLATGSELRAGGKGLRPGQIYESNRETLACLVRDAGGSPKVFPIVPDALDKTCRVLKKAFAGCDIVVTCGGVSVGEMDFVKGAFEKLGGGLEFWKVSVKPGKPFVFGRRGKKFLFGLPGNPVSAFVTFLLLVRPALLRWQGARETALPVHSGVLEESLANDGGRRHFMRVRIDATGKIRSAGIQASHILSSLAKANGLVDVPPQTILPAGAMVQVMKWE